ncbi:HEAT repeat domain-containing protein [Pseudomarimonas arenosa]|uniref:HEAT repeat domain-containing protein n=1 Tax=Pseudomarimonas arenosa TaxID=2774145 RepID=A0AAW3ZJB3_9GAMM|nr:HEAT repeat domain-containing protein [Pseudomarimonas arenosa]MBD8526170.1 HEAT repeat domain-containing protein [Pseudomarimonas arenosa]
MSAQYVLGALVLACAGAVGATEMPSLPDDGWVSWRVPMIEQSGDGPCCYEIRGTEVRNKGCTLGRRGAPKRLQWTSDGAGEAGGLLIFALREQGRTRQLHGLAANCPVSLDSTPQLLEGVPSSASLAWLDVELEQSLHKQVRSAAVVLMAQHADAQATGRLIQRSQAGQREQVRRDALFWLGQVRGAEGLPPIQRAAADPGAGDIQQHALFVLSQSDLPAAADSLLSVADDSGQSAESRGQALFWMAQSEHPQTRGAIEQVLRSKPSVELQEKAVFALSQLEQGADQALIDLIQGDYPRSAKKQALFWLGQSGSDQALRFLDRYLAGNVDPAN